jgi:hypothetical protein
VPAGEGYPLGGDYAATAAGEYVATVTPDGNHRWAEGADSTAAREVPWRIAPPDTPDPPLAVLDFLTYAVISLTGELIMNIKQLEADGYAVAAYRWYRNGSPVGTPTETFVDILKPGAAYYFELVTVGGEALRSTTYVYSLPTAVGAEGYAPLRTYPNPTRGHLIIVSEQGRAGDRVEVYSLQGVLVAAYPVAGELTTIDLAPLPAGTYLVKLGGRAAKVVKQ